MTQAKCATVVSTLITAGYAPTIRAVGAEYYVQVNDATGVLINTLKTFQDAQIITGRITSVEFS